MPPPPGMLAAVASGLALIRIVSLLLAAGIASTAVAQPPRPPSTGPGPEPARRDLWQMLTPKQREQLWRALSADQRADVWRSLDPQEQREIRDRNGGDPFDADGNGRSGGALPYAVGPERARQMSPEERQKMREQIREAHRQRRERLEEERRARPP